MPEANLPGMIDDLKEELDKLEMGIIPTTAQAEALIDDCLPQVVKLLLNRR